MVESGHMDGVVAYPEVDQTEGLKEDKEVAKAQDLHVMIAEIIRKYVQLQQTGFTWDLVYNGVCYRDIEFVLFTPHF